VSDEVDSGGGNERSDGTRRVLRSKHVEQDWGKGAVFLSAFGNIGWDSLGLRLVIFPLTFFGSNYTLTWLLGRGMASQCGISAGSDTEVCAVCEEVKGPDKALQCDVCKKWVHTKCGKISNGMYSEMKKVAGGTGCQGIKFFCSECDKLFEKIRIDLRFMIDQQSKFEIKQSTFEKGLEEMQKNIEAIQVNIKKIKEENKQEEANIQVAGEIGLLKNQIGELKVKYSDVTRVSGAEGTIVFQGQQNPSTRSIQLEVSEVMEREKRKLNLVIFGIDESNRC